MFLENKYKLEYIEQLILSIKEISLSLSLIFHKLRMLYSDLDNKYNFLKYALMFYKLIKNQPLQHIR